VGKDGPFLGIDGTDLANVVADIRCDFIGNPAGHSSARVLPLLRTERAGELFLSNVFGWLISLRVELTTGSQSDSEIYTNS
jgi:hypothetical protein